MATRTSTTTYSKTLPTPGFPAPPRAPQQTPYITGPFRLIPPTKAPTMRKSGGSGITTTPTPYQLPTTSDPRNVEIRNPELVARGIDPTTGNVTFYSRVGDREGFATQEEAERFAKSSITNSLNDPTFIQKLISERGQEGAKNFLIAFQKSKGLSTEQAILSAEATLLKREIKKAETSARGFTGGLRTRVEEFNKRVAEQKKEELPKTVREIQEQTSRISKTKKDKGFEDDNFVLNLTTIPDISKMDVKQGLLNLRKTRVQVGFEAEAEMKPSAIGIIGETKTKKLEAGPLLAKTTRGILGIPEAYELEKPKFVSESTLKGIEKSLAFTGLGFAGEFIESTAGSAGFLAEDIIGKPFLKGQILKGRLPAQETAFGTLNLGVSAIQEPEIITKSLIESFKASPERFAGGLVGDIALFELGGRAIGTGARFLETKFSSSVVAPEGIFAFESQAGIKPTKIKFEPKFTIEQSKKQLLDLTGIEQQQVVTHSTLSGRLGLGSERVLLKGFPEQAAGFRKAISEFNFFVGPPIEEIPTAYLAYAGIKETGLTTPSKIGLSLFPEQPIVYVGQVPTVKPSASILALGEAGKGQAVVEALADPLFSGKATLASTNILGISTEGQLIIPASFELPISKRISAGSFIEKVGKSKTVFFPQEVPSFLSETLPTIFKPRKKFTRIKVQPVKYSPATVQEARAFSMFKGNGKTIDVKKIASSKGVENIAVSSVAFKSAPLVSDLFLPQAITKKGTISNLSQLSQKQLSKDFISGITVSKPSVSKSKIVSSKVGGIESFVQPRKISVKSSFPQFMSKSGMVSEKQITSFVSGASLDKQKYSVTKSINKIYTKPKRLVSSTQNKLKSLKPTFPLFPFPKHGEKKQSEFEPSYTNFAEKFVEGFFAFTIKGGQKKKITEKPMSKQEALYFGAKYIEETPSASVFVEPAFGSKVKPSTRQFRFPFEKFRLPKSKKLLKLGALVEKSKYRIDQPEEFRGITFAGLEKLSYLRQKGVLPKKNGR